MEDFYTKPYLHFDKRKRYSHVKKYVENPSKISQHAFYPFILKVQKFRRYDKENGYKIKERNIFRTAHIDSCIYKYYSFMLSEKYELKLNTLGISESVLAYRSALGKSNIDFAAEIINFIYKSKQSYILVTDFSKFFDTLDHKLMKEALKYCLNEESLSKDWYNVYKSITKFSYYTQEVLNNKFGNESIQYNTGLKCYFKNAQEFRKFKSDSPLNLEQLKGKKGIAQGTAISAILSNVYMLFFDKKMSDYLSNIGGRYLRYADDIIIVIPSKHCKDVKIQKVKSELLDLAEKEMKLNINLDKTHEYYFDKDKIVDDKGNKSKLDYLGFVFDGYNVEMRQKSVSNFYKKAYKSIHVAKQRTFQKNSKHLIGKRHIYRFYTDKGAYDLKASKFGNFISYAKRSQKKFDKISPDTSNNMMKQMKNRKKKIIRRIKSHNEKAYQ
ncbi:reverse transcriptase/maturase family protein [Staphylococcus simulans]|uniref:reverse transcriptase/maturase family protein n=1 Tax=Staphylococcus simulans TaxID=1286 RepID=UPI000D03A448|nr:reverse transcriptase/maturase family protein [Staphylococcus simulans]